MLINNLTEEDIIKGILANDRNITAHFYKQLMPEVTRYVQKNSGTAEDAKDLFNDAFIEFFHNIKSGKYTAQNKLKGYF